MTIAPITPDIQSSPFYDAQSVFDATDQGLFQGLGNGVLAGCVVSPTTPTSSYAVDVSAGSIGIGVDVYAVSEAIGLAPSAPNIQDRKDIVLVGTNGTPYIKSGVPCGVQGWTQSSPQLPPVKPPVDDNTVLLAEIYIRGDIAPPYAPISTNEIIAKALAPIGFSGGILPDSLNIVYPGASTDTAFSEKLVADPYDRWSMLANGTFNLSNPLAPPRTGDHVGGTVGNGHDFLVGLESGIAGDVASVLNIQFQRTIFTDGTHFVNLTYGAPPLGTGWINATVPVTPTIPGQNITTLLNALNPANPLQVSNGPTTGVATFTGVQLSPPALLGVTTTGLTAGDGSQRYAIWIADFAGAPIMWLADFFGLYVNDQINFRYAGVTPSNEFDITVGFLNASSRTGGSGVLFGADGLANLKRINNSGNNWLVATTDTHALTWGNAGLWSNTAVELGTPFNFWGPAYVGTVTISNADTTLARFVDVGVNTNIQITAGAHLLNFGASGLWPSDGRELGTVNNPWGPVYAQGLALTEGSNAKQGVATLTAGTVTVTNSSVTATSRIILTPQDNSTTGAVRVSARTPGGGFTITSSNSGDTGSVAYMINEVGA